jgi:predicted phosphodiesterase
MRIAVFGDIHSNCIALKCLFKEISKYNVNHLIITGDIFGYYPWASETFLLIKKIGLPITSILGNHDQFILDKIANPNLKLSLSYWPAIEQNSYQLLSQNPEAINWLMSMDYKTEFRSNHFTYKIFHGTPDDPLNGRYYPDNQDKYSWFPEKNSMIILGHTHYPINKKEKTGGFIINPGSVGQPRDGNVDPSWILIDEDKEKIELLRFSYNIELVKDKLIKLEWDNRAIKALSKKFKGKLIL